MQRRDREITELDEISAIMGECLNATIAFGGDGPYAVPMSFGFEQKDGQFCLYLHCAGEGEKLRRMEQDPRAAFSMYTRETLRPSDNPAACTMDFLSVCGSGVLARLEGEEKRHGLDVLMAHYQPGKAFAYPEAALEAVTVLRLSVQAISGKRHGMSAA